MTMQNLKIYNFLLLMVLIISCGILFISYHKILSTFENNLPQLAEASFIYQIPEPPSPDVIITSPVSGSKFNIKNEVKIEFSYTDSSLILNASLDGKPVDNGDIIKGRDLFIGNHTLAVKFSSPEVESLSDTMEVEEVTFIVVPLVGVKGIIDNNGDFVSFIIEGLDIENIYDKNIGLIYHDKVNDTEVGLNSEDGLTSIGDYDEDNLPELRVDFNKAWIKDILDTNPYAEFTLRLELNEGMVLNISSSDWESQDPSQLLAVGLKDGVATISAIDITGDATSEVNIQLRDEIGGVITAEPLGVATNLSGDKIWVSFSDKKIRMYDSCGEFQEIDGVNPYWTVANRPDGLDWTGSELLYCSSETNKISRISSSGIETDLGVVKRRLSIDGVATDNLSVNYTTQEYEGYNPRAISRNYLSSGKISKRDTRLEVGENLIQTLPVTPTETPIWTNEQDSPAPGLGMVEVTDSSIPEGHVVYLSCTDGNIYKVRFEDKISAGIPAMIWRIAKKEHGWEPSIWYTYEPYTYIPGKYENNADYQPYSETTRRYGKVTLPEAFTFIEAFAIFRPRSGGWHLKWNGTQWVYVGLTSPYIAPTTHNICSYNENWTSGQGYNNPISGSYLWTQYHYTGSDPFEGAHPSARVVDVTNIIPTNTFYYTGRYGNEGQTFSVTFGPISYPIPIGRVAAGIAYNGVVGLDTWAFLTNNGSLTVLDQFTTSIPVPQGLAMGRLAVLDKIIAKQGDKIATSDSTADTLVICKGSTVDFEAFFKPDIAYDATWYKEKIDDDVIEEIGIGKRISHTFTESGKYFVRGECGGSSREVWIIVIDIEINPIEHVCVGASEDFIITVVGTTEPVTISLLASGGGSITLPESITTEGDTPNAGKTKLTGVSVSNTQDDVIITTSLNDFVCDTEELTVSSAKIVNISPDPFIEGDFTNIQLEPLPEGTTFECFKVVKIVDATGNEVKTYTGTGYLVQWNGQEPADVGEYTVQLFLKYQENLTLVDTGKVTMVPRLKKTEITYSDRFLKLAYRWVNESISLSSKTYRPNNKLWPEDMFPLNYLWGGELLSGTTKITTRNFTLQDLAGRYTSRLDVRSQDNQSANDTVKLVLGAVPDQASIVEFKPPGRLWRKEATIVHKFESESRIFFREFTDSTQENVLIDYAIFLGVPPSEAGPTKVELDEGIYDDLENKQLRIWTANFVNVTVDFVFGHPNIDPMAPLLAPIVRELFEGR